MARKLTTHVIDLLIDPTTIETYTGVDVPALERGPTSSAVAWDIISGTMQIGDALQGAAFQGPVDSVFMARARLPKAAGLYITDTVFNVTVNGPRTVATPPLEPTGVRKWEAVELYFKAPSGTSCTFRVSDGTERWWNGSAWAAATDPAAHWSSAQSIQDHIGTFPVAARAIQFICRLGCTDDSLTPSFFGARVAYGCVEIDELDDALVRTFLAGLRSNVQVTGFFEDTAEQALSVVTVPGEEWTYEVLSVDAVFDLTTDPLEGTELPGTYSSSAKTWTPTTPIPAGHVYRLEFSYRPHMVVRQHRDIVPIDRLPALLVTPKATSQEYDGGQPCIIRNVYASPPVGIEYEARASIELNVDLRVLGELAGDVGRLAAAVRHWLNDGKTMVSPISGEVVNIHLQGAFVDSSDSKGGGIPEQRADLVLTYRARPGQNSRTIPLVRAGGVQFSQEL